MDTYIAQLSTEKQLGFNVLLLEDTVKNVQLYWMALKEPYGITGWSSELHWINWNWLYAFLQGTSIIIIITRGGYR